MKPWAVLNRIWATKMISFVLQMNMMPSLNITMNWLPIQLLFLWHLTCLKFRASRIQGWGTLRGWEVERLAFASDGESPWGFSRHVWGCLNDRATVIFLLSVQRWLEFGHTWFGPTQWGMVNRTSLGWRWWGPQNWGEKRGEVLWEIQSEGWQALGGKI